MDSMEVEDSNVASAVSSTVSVTVVSVVTVSTTVSAVRAAAAAAVASAPSALTAFTCVDFSPAFTAFTALPPSLPMLLTDPSTSFGTEGTTTFVSSTVSRHASFAAGVALSAAAFTAFPRNPPTLSNRTLDRSSLSRETVFAPEEEEDTDTDGGAEPEVETEAEADFVADFVVRV